jgi:hypothetical protein
MELMAFKAAQNWIRNSRKADTTENLPTPLQYGMAFNLTSNPGLYSISLYLRYLFSRHQKVPQFIKWLFIASIVQVGLGTLTAVADIWLHLTATSVPWQTVTPLSSISTSYSRALTSNCTSGEYEYKGENMSAYSFGTYTCATRDAATNDWINGIVEGLSTVNNISSVNTVHQVDGISFLGPSQPLSTLDFRATTPGMRSSCKPISTICQLGLDEIGAGTPYNCSNSYPGVAGEAALFGLKVYVDGSWRPFGTGLNPIPFAVSITIDTITEEIVPDKEFVAPVHGNYAILLWCEAEVLDVTYEVTANDVSIVLTNRSSNVTTWPLSGALAIQVNSIAQPLWLAAEIDAISGNSTLFSNLFADDLSRITIGIAAGIMTSTPTLEESSRITSLVARLPKAPLFSLIILLFLYTIISIYLAIQTMFRYSGLTLKGGPVGANEQEIVKTRLTSPFAVIHECFGDSAFAGRISSNQMFRDDTDGVLRVRNPERYGIGQGNVLELAAKV